MNDVGNVAEDSHEKGEKGFCESRSEGNGGSNLYFAL